MELSTIVLKGWFILPCHCNGSYSTLSLSIYSSMARKRRCPAIHPAATRGLARLTLWISSGNGKCSYFLCSRTHENVRRALTILCELAMLVSNSKCWCTILKQLQTDFNRLLCCISTSRRLGNATSLAGQSRQYTSKWQVVRISGGAKQAMSVAPIGLHRHCKAT